MRLYRDYGGDSAVGAACRDVDFTVAIFAFIRPARLRAEGNGHRREQ